MPANVLEALSSTGAVDPISNLQRARVHLWRGENDTVVPKEEAVDLAVRWTGRPVILTSVVLFVGFLTFLASGFKATADFGSISAVTIAAAVVGDLILLPAMLLLWPPKTPR